MNSRARVLVALLVVAAIAFVGWRTWGGRRTSAPAGAPADTAQAGMRSITLWFADASGDSLVVESRTVVEQEGLHARVSQLIDALARGPERRGVAVLPAGTALVHVYLDDRGLLVLDLSRAFQQGFRGGSREEDLIIGSLRRTLGANVPEAQRVRFTCGGAPIGSLGGHVPLDQPLDLHEDL